MQKIMVYANMEGIYSSRKIMSACIRDIKFIWLLNGAPAPSYHEIARFRSKRLTECGEELFYQLVQKLHELGEIKYEHLFVDGTKIEANANKYSFVWQRSITKYITPRYSKNAPVVSCLNNLPLKPREKQKRVSLIGLVFPRPLFPVLFFCVFGGCLLFLKLSG